MDDGSEGKSRYFHNCKFYTERRPNGDVRWVCSCGTVGKWWEAGFANQQWRLWRDHAQRKLQKLRADITKQKRIDKVRDQFRRHA